MGDSSTNNLSLVVALVSVCGTILTTVLTIGSAIYIAHKNSEQIKKERSHDFKKEYFFERQKKASEMLKSVNSFQDLAYSYKSEITYPMMSGSPIVPTKDHVEYKKVFFQNVVIFFPELIELYNDSMQKFIDLSACYGKVLLKVPSKELYVASKKDKEDFNRLYKSYDDSKGKFIMAIKVLMERDRIRLEESS